MDNSGLRIIASKLWGEIVTQRHHHAQFFTLADQAYLEFTRSITLRSKFNDGAMNMLTRSYTLGFEAPGSLSQSDFGMDKCPSLIGDQVELEILPNSRNISLFN